MSKPRGFAAMDPDLHREIASQGGHAAHADGVAHQWTPEEARLAGAKGGRERARRMREQKELETKRLPP